MQFILLGKNKLENQEKALEETKIIEDLGKKLYYDWFEQYSDDGDDDEDEAQINEETFNIEDINTYPDWALKLYPIMNTIGKNFDCDLCDALDEIAGEISDLQSSLYSLVKIWEDQDTYQDIVSYGSLDKDMLIVCVDNDNAEILPILATGIPQKIMNIRVLNNNFEIEESPVATPVTYTPISEPKSHKRVVINLEDEEGWDEDWDEDEFGVQDESLFL